LSGVTSWSSMLESWDADMAALELLLSSIVGKLCYGLDQRISAVLLGGDHRAYEVLHVHQVVMIAKHHPAWPGDQGKYK
jgi:hypothetical protein